MKKTAVFFLVLASFMMRAQDSIVKKRIRHEIGFNTVLLVKQLISNNANSASSTLPQLPYQLIYTFHSMTGYGMRLGLGVNASKNETTISGQPKPRITSFSSNAYRLGLNYNFLRYSRFTCNTFFDALYENSKSKTVTTTTSSGPFGPIQSTVETNVSSGGPGGAVGFGLKFSFNKHISLYTEVPLQFKRIVSNNSETESTNGIIDTFTTSSGTDTNAKIVLPTTLFLTISF